MKKRGIRTHQWKFIYPLEIPDLHGNSDIELYDLYNDPGELVNLVHERPEVVARFTKQLEDWVAERLAATNSEDPLPLHPIPLR
ncbi:MAG: sulfatase, partial [Armatimonadetes bacterium]|nr:sulfatase [Armatimonadota bacterium]